MLLSDIQAQPAALETLRRALERGRLAQSYLFAGPSGVGKQAVALALACARNCETAAGQGCGQCRNCARILAGSHPDVRVFGPRNEGNRNLPVEFVRTEVLPFAQFAPFEARTAFIVFPEADICFPQHHAQAANAILKTIEEPRDNVVFILLSERPTRLLPTIRSRCQKVRFGPLPHGVVSRIMASHGIDLEHSDAALALCGGRADRALALCEEDRAQAMLQWTERLEEALEQGAPGHLLDLAEALSKDPDRGLILDALALYYRDVAAVGLASEDLVFFRHRRDALQQRAQAVHPARAAARVASIERAMEDLARNANPEINLDALLFGMP